MSSHRKRRPQSKKSCTACIKAKRRCERSTGACVRCNKQRLDCYFLPPPSLDSEGLIAARKNSTTTDGEEDPESAMVQDSTFDFLNFNPEENIQTGAIDSSLGIDDLFDLTVNTPEFGRHLSPTAVGPLVTTNSSRNCKFDSSSSSIASRVERGINELKSAPAKMVNENQTAWSHALLYEDMMPKSMQGAAQSSFMQRKYAKCILTRCTRGMCALPS
jgi:hypothetical protein